jgi:hypothetical protein
LGCGKVSGPVCDNWSHRDLHVLEWFGRGSVLRVGLVVRLVDCRGGVECRRVPRPASRGPQDDICCGLSTRTDISFRARGSGVPTGRGSHLVGIPGVGNAGLLSAVPPGPVRHVHLEWPTDACPVGINENSLPVPLAGPWSAPCPRGAPDPHAHSKCTALWGCVCAVGSGVPTTRLANF